MKQLTSHAPFDLLHCSFFSTLFIVLPLYVSGIHFVVLIPINASFKKSKSDSKNEKLPRNFEVLRAFLFCAINMG